MNTTAAESLDAANGEETTSKSKIKGILKQIERRNPSKEKISSILR